MTFHEGPPNQDSLSRTFRPVELLFLARYGRLAISLRDQIPKLDPKDMRVKLTLKAFYSTYRDLENLGLSEEARLIRDRFKPS